jgi:hypothetical protein
LAEAWQRTVASKREVTFDMSQRKKEFVTIPEDTFFQLLWLQAFYAMQLNAYDGGGRRPARLDHKTERLLHGASNEARDALRERQRLEASFGEDR